MDIIRTGIGLHKTIRNVARMREIAIIFAKHGFDEFITLGGIPGIPNFILPKSKKKIKDELSDEVEKNWPKILGYRLRLCFEELGPAFIKFGQLLSSREDIFDQAFIEEMKILRDKVKAIPFSQVKDLVEESLGKKIDEVFRSIDPEPIGTASIGVVYKGVLLDGSDVVIKVRRPNIEKMMETDFSILRFLSVQAERVSEEVKFLGVSRIVRDFSSTLVNELNFFLEVLNRNRFAKIIEHHGADELIYIPKFYEEYCREDILVMEFMKGIPFSSTEKIEKHIDDIKVKLDEGLMVFIKNFLQDGFFHADLHGGNFFYLDNGKIGIIDFGLMGTLSKNGRKNFIAIIYSIITFNFEHLVYEFLDVAEYERIPDVDQLINDIRDALSPYVGLTVQQTDFNLVLKEILDTLKKHEIFLPREWFIVFRALITLDGVGRSIGLDFDIYAMMEGDIKDIVKETFNKQELIEEALWAGKDIVTSSRMFPRHMKWFLKTWSKNGYSFDLNLKGFQDPLSSINSSIIFLGLIVLSCVFLISGNGFLGAGAVDSWRDVHVLTWIFWFFSFCSLGIAFLRLKR